MRQGRVFRRCGKCNRSMDGLERRRCARCGHDRQTWAYVVDLTPLGAPRQQKFKAGFATKRDALAAMNELQAAAAHGSYVAPSKVTVGAFLDDWLVTARARLRPGAYDACEGHVRCYVKPHIGEVPLQALTPKRVKQLYARLGETGRIRGRGQDGGKRNGDPGLSAKTVHNIHRTLSRALEDAVNDRLLTRNPAKAAHRQPESPEQATWTAAQVRVFLESVGTDRLFALWRVAASTGLRRGELVGLRWPDVDFHAGRIAVVQQRAKGGGTVAVGPTKTKRSRRLVSLDAGTITALRQHREAQDKEKELLGAAYGDEDLVFCRPDGSALHPDRVTQLFREHVRRAGLPWIKLHGLRHSHATLMLRAGVHPKVVQERLGHSSIAITLDTYSHAIPAMQEDAASRVARIVDQEETDEHDRRPSADAGGEERDE